MTITYATQTKLEFGTPTTLHRAECACGWRSCWYAERAYAERWADLHGVDRHGGEDSWEWPWGE